MSTENEGAGTPDESAGGTPGPASGPASQQPAAPSPAAPPPPPPGPAPASAPPASAPSPYAPLPQAPPPPPPPPQTGAAPWSAFPPPPPPRKRPNGLLAGILAATLVAGGIGGGVGYLVADRADNTASESTVRAGTEQDPGTAARPPESVAGIAEAALPSVVTIETGGLQEGGTGTGFVYDEEGHIMTNNHVVASAAEGGNLTATFSDGESFEAEVVGRAEGYDVAVLRLLDAGERDLEPLPVGNSADVAVGDATVAIGAPFGLSGTVTTGIISAKNRPVASSDGQGGSASYMSALQTDASINPGNSGGPLLDADGSVIGVNSAIQSTSGGLGQAGSIGLGFAIPINQAQRVAEDLIETGEPVYALIGASIQMGTQSGGARVSDSGPGNSEPVTPGGPADAIGLRPGDVIVRFGDRVIDSGPTLISEIWTYEPGDEVELTYERNGTEHTETLTLDRRVGD